MVYISLLLLTDRNKNEFKISVMQLFYMLLSVMFCQLKGNSSNLILHFHEVGGD